MICSLSKWFISGSLDSNKEVPGFVRHHLKKCGDCQEFLQFSQTLEKRAAQDAASILQETPDSLLEKVKSTRLQPPDPRRRPRWIRTLIPAVSVSLAAVLFAVFILFRPFQTPPSPVDEGFSLFNSSNSFLFGRDSIPGGSLQNLASQLETPFDSEWLSLKNAIKSATDRLSTRLDLKIDRREN